MVTYFKLRLPNVLFCFLVSAVGQVISSLCPTSVQHSSGKGKHIIPADGGLPRCSPEQPAISPVFSLRNGRVSGTVSGPHPGVPCHAPWYHLPLLYHSERPPADGKSQAASNQTVAGKDTRSARLTTERSPFSMSCITVHRVMNSMWNYLLNKPVDAFFCRLSVCTVYSVQCARDAYRPWRIIAAVLLVFCDWVYKWT